MNLKFLDPSPDQTSKKPRDICQEQPHGLFQPSKGLCLICAEGLSALLSQAEVDSKLQSMHAPAINNLFFADDSLFFCDANLECKEILQTCELASGLKTNLENFQFLLSQAHH